MRILVVTPHAADADVAAALAGKGRIVEICRDGKAARAFMEKDRFDVALIDWTLAAPSGAEIVRSMRSTELDTHTYVIAMMASPAPVAIAGAFQCGVDDVLRRPVIREELLGRVGALDRIKQWATKVLSSSGIAQDWSNGTNVAGLRAWTDAASTVGADIQGVLGREVRSTTTSITLDPGGLCAEVPLTLANEGLDVCFIVSVDLGSLRALGEIVFGQEMGLDAMRDVVRELANTGGGAFKRAAEAEGVLLTTGLPQDLPAAQRATRTGAVVSDFVVDVPGSQARIAFRLLVRSRALERITPNKLAEGMVLAKDLLGENGALLVPSGTRLTEATCARLGRMLRPNAVVEIARAA